MIKLVNAECDARRKGKIVIVIKDRKVIIKVEMGHNRNNKSCLAILK